MIKNIFSPIFFLLFLIFASSFITNEWVLLQKENYKILFPQAPSIDSTLTDSKIGKLFVYNYMYESPENTLDSNLVYGLSVTDYPEKYFSSTGQAFLKGFFDGMVNGAVKNISGKLLSEKEIIFKTYPGREIRIDYGEGAAIVNMKFILVQNKIFALQTISLTGKENNCNASKFYSSFDIQ
ncbi:MAG: hypothetical protein ABIO04_02440 [Ferruginibacter sp.]